MSSKTLQEIRTKFLHGCIGSKENCAQIKRQLSEFIAGTLKMELSEEKTLIRRKRIHVENSLPEHQIQLEAHPVRLAGSHHHHGDAPGHRFFRRGSVPQSSQQSAMSNGETLVIYETFRPAVVQSAVRDNFAALWDSDSGVSAGMDKAIAMGYAREQGWFIAKGTSNHQAGLAVDMSLAKGDPAELHEYTLDGSTYRKYEEWTEYEMPTRMHELSSGAIRYQTPASSYTMPGDLENWTERFAASEGAKRLQSYCTAAGLSPGSPGG